MQWLQHCMLSSMTSLSNRCTVGCYSITCRGLKPSTPVEPQHSLTKQQIAEACRRRSTDELEGGVDAVKGVGYQRYLCMIVCINFPIKLCFPSVGDLRCYIQDRKPLQREE